eukprot:6187255-Pleurochrysis_carterae.AAC.1
MLQVGNFAGGLNARVRSAVHASRRSPSEWSAAESTAVAERLLRLHFFADASVCAGVNPRTPSRSCPFVAKFLLL